MLRMIEASAMPSASTAQLWAERKEEAVLQGSARNRECAVPRWYGRRF